MKICLFVRDDQQMLSNRIFSNTEIYGMKSDTYMYAALQQELQKLGITIATQDILRPEHADLVICLNETTFFTTYTRPPGQRCYLILSEPPVYNAADWTAERHQLFDKVFTYDSSRVDGRKYFEYNYPIDLPKQPVSFQPAEKEYSEKKLLCLMASAFTIEKDRSGSGSLLYQRYEAIKWFAHHHAGELDFFARNAPQLNTRFFRGAGILRKFSPSLADRISNRIFTKNIAPVYRGAAPAMDKIKMLGNYKFYLCYENNGGINGLISEKIFDCLLSGCVPVYLGAPDIAELIPADCFIDKQKFDNYEKLYDFLSTMPYEQYIGYLQAATNFLQTEKSRRFRVSEFCNNLITHISNDLAL